MEYYLCRAIEVVRLSNEQLMQLQMKERNLKRVLYPFEIQECFKLPTLKETWEIPNDDQAMTSHNNKLRKELKGLGFAPIYDFVSSDVDLIHEYDMKIKNSTIDFLYSRTSKRVRDSVEDLMVILSFLPFLGVIGRI